jgi:hypothetical protein
MALRHRPVPRRYLKGEYAICCVCGWRGQKRHDALEDALSHWESHHEVVNPRDRRATTLWDIAILAYRLGHSRRALRVGSGRAGDGGVMLTRVCLIGGAVMFQRGLSPDWSGLSVDEALQIDALDRGEA